MELLKQNHIKYALYQCAVLAICLLLMQATGQNESFDQKNPLIFFSTFIATFAIWFLGIRARKQQQKGKLTFKQGFIEGFKISLAYGIVSPFIYVIYYLMINPEIMEYLRIAYGSMGLTNVSDTMIILADMLIQFLSAVIFGSLYGAVATLFLKTKASK